MKLANLLLTDAGTYIRTDVGTYSYTNSLARAHRGALTLARAEREHSKIYVGNGLNAILTVGSKGHG